MFNIEFQFTADFQSLGVNEREALISDLRDDIEEVLSRYSGSIGKFETFSAGELKESK